MDEVMLAGLRQHRRDRYLALLLSPPAAQEDLLALYALDTELERIPHLVSEPQLADIRLQWWVDSLEADSTVAPASHPLLAAVTQLAARHAIPRAALATLASARQRLLTGATLATATELEAHLGETESAIMAMAALVLGAHDTQKRAQAAGLAGVALGLCRLLGSLPAARAQGHCPLPDDMLARHGATAGDVLAGRNATAVAQAIQDCVQLAAIRWGEAQAALAHVPQQALAAFLPVAPVPRWLKKLERMSVRLLTEPCAPSALRQQWDIWRAARRGRV